MHLMVQPKEAPDQHPMSKADSWCVLKQSSATHSHEGLDILELAVV